MPKRIQFDLLELFDIKSTMEMELSRTIELSHRKLVNDLGEKIYDKEIERYKNIIKKVQRAIDSYFNFA